MIRSTLLELAVSPLMGAVLVVVKSSIVFGLGFLLAHLFRRRSAAWRHFIWVGTLCGALAVPIMTLALPRLEWPVISAPPAVVNAPNGTPSASTPMTPSEIASASVPASIENEPSPTQSQILAGIWFGGAFLVAIWCAIGHIALLRIARRARLVDDPSWLAALEDASRSNGVTKRVRLFYSGSVDSPMTWGYRHPIVLLPESAAAWTGERRRVVLLHELAHIARVDFVAQLVAAFACAFYWFHPAAWAAASRLRHESEQACDDRALVAGTPATDYASHLLSLALQAKANHWHEAMAIGLTRSATLEARIRAVLDEHLTRRRPSPRICMAGSMILTMFVLLLSVLTPVRAALNASVLDGTLPSNATAVAEVVPHSDESSSAVVSRTLDANPGEELDLRLEAGGSVTIQGWNERQVQVEGRLGGRDADKIRVDVDRVEEGIQVRVYFTEDLRSQSSSNEFKIRVPRRFDVSLNSAGGGLKISKVEGSFKGSTGGGEIVLDHVAGDAELSTGGSDIRVTDSHLDGEVSTGGGRVDLIRVTGELVGASGNGPVRSFDSVTEARLDELNRNADELSEDLKTLTVNSKRMSESADESAKNAARLSELADESAKKAARITKSGGGVELSEIPHGADISTGGGDIVIGKTGGVVDLSTGGGDIEVGPVSGSLSASTGAGNVRVRVGDADKIDLSSGSGNVILELPASFSGTIELETGYTKNLGHATRIVSDWNLVRESTTDWDGSGGQTPRRYVRAHGTIGNGQSRVRVETVNGNIELRRARP